MKRTSRQQLLAVTARDGPLYLQIYHRIRILILTGVWSAGTQLPSSRALARDLGVSRNTAILALEKLVADGWVTSRPGSGMYVSSEAPPARPRLSESTETALSRSHAPVAFEISEAATDIFDIDQWSKVQRRVWIEAGREAVHEGAIAGWGPLRVAIASYINAVRGLLCSPEQVFIVAETQSALDLCARVLAKPNDKIWIENPGYPYARAVFEQRELTQVAVPVDARGIVVSEGIRAAPSAKLAYITPSCQFPTSCILSSERRQELLAWARHAKSYILEDDWDFNAAFAGSTPPEPLAASNPDRVILIHSFNRILFPALRIAAVIVPQALIGAFEDGLFAMSRFQNTANQMALAQFIDEGLLTSHLRRVRLACEERRNAMTEAVRKHLWRWIQLQERQRGYHVIASQRGSNSALAASARSGGIACVAISDFVVGEAHAHDGVILGFAAFDLERIESGIGELQRILAQAL